ncbi:hypothetical protein P7K49_013533 [Saguinus oedipus]|uniref:Uncharacterized protein n=1 Tax=Saguinus oedipus TaxID=9490 RepID=A0ABQ9VIB1_SAGOE|nr:hypothetical protein P7K49_013533 [Saguinus oedipus]
MVEAPEKDSREDSQMGVGGQAGVQRKWFLLRLTESTNEAGNTKDAVGRDQLHWSGRNSSGCLQEHIHVKRLENGSVGNTHPTACFCLEGERSPSLAEQQSDLQAPSQMQSRKEPSKAEAKLHNTCS